MNTCRTHFTLSWTSLLKSLLSARVPERVEFGYLTVPRYIISDTILTSSSSWPALASGKLMTW